MKFWGAPYPIVRHANGFLHTQRGAAQVKSDLLSLLLTNPGERVMLPDFGTPLNRLFFDPNDAQVAQEARDMIVTAIEAWEPRIVVSDIEVNTNVDDSLSPLDEKVDIGHILLIRINFSDFDNIQEVQELRLEVPLGGV
jgi:phage baseplate assembly protein W